MPCLTDWFDMVFGESVPECDTTISAKKSNETHSEYSLPEKDKSIIGLVGNNLPPYLGQNVPNPFRHSTVISYYLPPETEDNARLKISDITGREIKEVNLNNDLHFVELFFNSVENGVYYYSLIIEGELIRTRRMILIK